MCIRDRNYLFLNDLDGARVEVRKADLRQKEEEEKHQRELKKLEEYQKKQNVENRSIDSVMANYAVLDDYAANVVSSFKNAFTYFVSGIIYEAAGDLNDARIDYEKSFHLYKTKSVLKKLIEVNHQLGDREAVDRWSQVAKDSYQEIMALVQDDSHMGEIVVMYLVGQVPQLKGTKFSLWTPGKNFNVAFPFYDPVTFYSGEHCLEVGINGNGSIGRTETLVDFIPIITKSLKKRMPGIIVRQVIRLLTKRSVEKESGKRLGLLGKLAAKVINTVTERPDLRGWYELPATVQGFVEKVEPGTLTLNLKAKESGYEQFSRDVNVEVAPGRKTLVIIQCMGNRRAVHSVQI